MKRFERRVAIVTGSSNGIGRAIAVLLAQDGASVVVTGRDEMALKETLTECVNAGVNSERILIVQGDITKDEFRKKLVNDTLNSFGKLDILVNNAGALDKDNCGKGPGFQNQDIDSYDYIMALNLRSIVSLLYLCLPHLESTKGDVVNISSIGGLQGAMPNFPFYSTSKAALCQLTRSLAYEYIPKGVRFNTVCPGLVATKILQKQGLPEELSRKLEHSMEQNPMNIPGGFVGTPEDIANVVAFLADRKTSRYIIGSTIVVDGGSHIVMPLVTGNFHDHM